MPENRVVHNPFNKAALPDAAKLPDGTPDHTLDITREICPMTFVRTRLMLDRMTVGETLLVLLRGEEPVRSVPQAATALGHAVLDQAQGEDGVTRLLLRKA